MCVCACACALIRTSYLPKKQLQQILFRKRAGSFAALPCQRYQAPSNNGCLPQGFWNWPRQHKMFWPHSFPTLWLGGPQALETHPGYFLISTSSVEARVSWYKLGIGNLYFSQRATVSSGKSSRGHMPGVCRSRGKRVQRNECEFYLRAVDKFIHTFSVLHTGYLRDIEAQGCFPAVQNPQT